MPVTTRSAFRLQCKNEATKQGVSRDEASVRGPPRPRRSTRTRRESRPAVKGVRRGRSASAESPARASEGVAPVAVLRDWFAQLGFAWADADDSGEVLNSHGWPVPWLGATWQEVAHDMRATWRCSVWNEAVARRGAELGLPASRLVDRGASSALLKLLGSKRDRAVLRALLAAA